MAFNGTEGKPISKTQAKEWTKNYQVANPKKVKAFFFGKDHLQQLLNESNQDGASMGIRIYYALDEDGNDRMVLVAATENENNILSNPKMVEGAEDPIIDAGKPCPPYCPKDPDTEL